MIALEELNGIRVHARIRGKQRRTRNSSFRELRSFLHDKVLLVGIMVVVDTVHTSHACNCCGCLDKRNRPEQACHTAPADFNASLNIRDQAAVKQPLASGLRVQAQATGC